MWEGMFPLAIFPFGGLFSMPLELRVMGLSIRIVSCNEFNMGSIHIQQNSYMSLVRLGYSDLGKHYEL